ncbi:MAG: hypothetical protein OXB86_06405 [Bdellovibrionales bacterium]|nr:hypothetical protein [Bdellovibrionales bacterium]
MLGLGMLLGACTPPVQYPPPGYDSSDRSVRKPNDREREIDKRRKTGECAKDDNCSEICDDIFTARKDREECEEYSIADVESIEDVFKVLEDPDLEDLEDLKLTDLEFLLDISPSPLEKSVSRMKSSSERKDFLAWLATNSEAANIVANAEDDFGIMKDLFGSGSASSIVQEINKTVDGGDNFVEIALDEGNEVALEWLHDFYGDKCENKDRYETCIFRDFYCGLKLSSDFDEQFFDYTFFEDMLDEVLETEQGAGVANAYTAEDWGTASDSTYGEWPAGTEAGDLESWNSAPNNVCGEVEADDYAAR